MTIRYYSNGSSKDRVVTDTCSLCGAVYELDYYEFASHVYSEHGPADIGLAPLGEVEATATSGLAVAD